MDSLTDFYCSQCRRPLNKAGAMDENHAWCDSCESVVRTSQMRTKGWVIGAVVVMVGNLLFRLWI